MTNATSKTSIRTCRCLKNMLAMATNDPLFYQVPLIPIDEIVVTAACSSYAVYQSRY